MTDDPPRSVAPNANGNLDPGTLVELLAEHVEVRSNPTASLAPSAGRVAKDAEDGTVYVGDGEAWLDATEQLGYESPEIRTDSLLTSDGNAWETLREMGYETGDFVALGPSMYDQPKRTYTNASYSDRSQMSWNTQWNRWAPSGGGQTGVLLHFGVSGGVADIRLYNKTDSEVVCEITDESSATDTVEKGPFQYTPTTTDSVVDIVPQIADVGDSDPKINKLLVQWGVFL